MTTPMDHTPHTDRGDSPDGSPQDGNEAFDAALSELLDAEEDTPAPAAVEDPSSGDDDANKSADPDAPPAPSPEDAAADQGTASDDSPPGNKSQDDPWASAPEELRRLREQETRDAELRHKSAAMRQTSMQRRIAELEAQAKQGTQGSDQAKGEQGEKGEQQGGGDADELEASIAQLREDYPDVAEPILNKVAQLEATVQKLSGTAQQFEKQQGQAALAEQEGELAKSHPDWETVGRDERIDAWITTQPTSVQQAFFRNSRGIVDAADAALVLDRFKADMGIATSAGPSEAEQAAQAQQQRREAQLKGNRDTSGANGPAASTGFGKDDFDGVVAAYADHYDKAL